MSESHKCYGEKDPPSSVKKKKHTQVNRIFWYNLGSSFFSFWHSKIISPLFVYLLFLIS